MTTQAQSFKHSPVNTANYSAHYFYGYGSTQEEALEDALLLAKERDPSAHISQGVVYFHQPVYF